MIVLFLSLDWIDGSFSSRLVRAVVLASCLITPTVHPSRRTIMRGKGRGSG